MEQQKIKIPTQKIYETTWQKFIDRSMNIITESPTITKFILKYIPKKHTFILKITDGNRIVMKKSKANQEYDQIQKFTILIGRVLTNETQEKKQRKDQLDQAQKDKKKKNKKKNK